MRSTQGWWQDDDMSCDLAMFIRCILRLMAFSSVTLAKDSLSYKVIITLSGEPFPEIVLLPRCC